VSRVLQKEEQESAALFFFFHSDTHSVVRRVWLEKVPLTIDVMLLICKYLQNESMRNETRVGKAEISLKTTHKDWRLVRNENPPLGKDPIWFARKSLQKKERMIEKLEKKDSRRSV
jgi:hypothetical protein